jgi:diaminopimelate epimerase
LISNAPDILPPVRFGKWHGAGNAYLVIEAADAPVDLTPARVARICHPDLGAGSDGILVVSGRDVRILNPDGSDAEFSGNGSRIAAAHIAARDACSQLELVTPKGPIAATVDGTSVTIDAGTATLEGPDHRPDGGPPPAPVYTFVNLGNPHCVIEDATVDRLDLLAVGAPIEHHAWFPNRTNVEFYRPVAGHEIRMRVWERGAGETLSSGSGSSAAAVAAVVSGRVESPVTVHADGGDLVVEVSADLAVRLTGPVEHVCDGVFSDAFVAGLERL